MPLRIVSCPCVVALVLVTLANSARADDPPPIPRGYSIPLIDLADQEHRQVVVDREQGQYLGHPTTVLLEDGRTIIAVYPKGHGRGAIVLKRSTDGGLHWSDRLPDARELGHLEGDADDPPRRRSAGHEAADPVLGPVPDPHGRLRGRRPHLDAAGADRRLRRHRRHGQRRAAEGRRLHGPLPRRRAVPSGRGQGHEVPGLQDDLGGRRPDLGPAGGHRRAPGGPPLRAGPDPLPRRRADRRAPAGEQPQVQLVRHLLRRRGQDLDRAEGVAGGADRRPARRQVRPGRPALHLLPGHDAREPDEGAIGSAGSAPTTTSCRARRASTGSG